MNIKEKITYIASKKSLRIEQWRDGHGHWRAGIEWYDQDNFEFICEKHTLEECLDMIIEHMKDKEA